MNEFGPHVSYWIGRLVRPRLLPGRDCNKRLCLPQGIKANGCGDTGGIRDARTSLGYTTAVPASSKVGGVPHQANLSTQEAVPPAGARISPPHGLQRRCAGSAKPASQGPPAPRSVVKEARALEAAFPAAQAVGFPV